MVEKTLKIRLMSSSPDFAKWAQPNQTGSNLTD